MDDTTTMARPKLGVFVPHEVDVSRVDVAELGEAPIIDAATPGAWIPERDEWTLSAEHVELGVAHAVLPDVLARHCYTDPTNGRLAFVWDDGTRRVPQHRLSEAERTPDGPKYLFPSDSGKIVNHLRTGQPDAPLLLVEGSFQSLAALSWAPEHFGIAAIAGCSNWDLPGLLEVVNGRHVVVFLDADAVENPDVWWHGFKRLKSALEQAGALKPVKFHESSGSKKSGLDDDLAALPADARHDVIGRMVDGATPRMNKPAPRKQPEPERQIAEQLLQTVNFDGVAPVLLGNEVEAVEWLKAEIPKTPSFFIRGGQLVHMIGVTDEGYVHPEHSITDDEPEWYRIARNGSRQVVALNAASLRARVQADHSFMMWSGSQGGHTPKLFPKEAAELVVSDPEPLHGMRMLRGIVAAPMFLTGNRILQVPGYDPGSGYYYTPDRSLNMPPVSDEPSADELKFARELIDTMLWDFPFVTPDDKATYAGYLFLPLIKDLVPPPYKMLGITAPTKGSGKGYLSAGLTIIHHGPGGGILKAGLPEREEEIRKYISTILAVTAGDMVVFDNVRTEIKGQALEFLMTSATWNDRELGANRSIHEVNDRIWVANGNNLQVSGDMARRVALCTIDTGLENPQDRTQFRIPGAFPQWVTDNRGTLLWALLTLTRGWYLSGGYRPPVDSSDTFSEATSLVRGILNYASLRGVGTFDSKALRITGQEDEGWGRFLLAVHEWQDQRRGATNGWWKVDDLKQDCQGLNQWGIDLADVPGLEDVSLPSTRKISTCLTKVGGRPASGYRVRRLVDAKGRPSFTVQPL